MDPDAVALIIAETKGYPYFLHLGQKCFQVGLFCLRRLAAMDFLVDMLPHSSLSSLNRPAIEALLFEQESRLAELEALEVEQSVEIVQLNQTIAELREEQARLIAEMLL
jgi:hypothetical protein